MNNYLLGLKPLGLKPHSALRPFGLSLCSGLLVTFVALQCTPLLADEVDDVAKYNAVSAPQDGMSWMSGGIGDEARDEMRKAAAGYSVHLVFSDRNGSYLAGIPFTVSRLNGREIYSGVSEGPLLYLKLAPGAYQIAARFNGVWQNKRVRVGASGGSAKMSFVAKGE